MATARVGPTADPAAGGRVVPVLLCRLWRSPNHAAAGCVVVWVLLQMQIPWYCFLPLLALCSGGMVLLVAVVSQASVVGASLIAGH